MNAEGTANTQRGIAESEQQAPRINWEDPSVPVGDSPRLPRWPLAVACVVWAGWVVFLFAMMLSSRPA